jgi:hypothetical protein
MGTKIRRKEFPALSKLPLLVVLLATLIIGIALLAPIFKTVKKFSPYFNHAIRFSSPTIVPWKKISAKDLQEARKKVERACRELEDQYNGLYEFDSESNHLEARYEDDPTWFSDYYITNPQFSSDQETWEVTFRSFTVTSMRNISRKNDSIAITRNGDIRDQLKRDLDSVKESIFRSDDDGSG